MSIILLVLLVQINVLYFMATFQYDNLSGSQWNDLLMYGWLVVQCMT